MSFWFCTMYPGVTYFLSYLVRRLRSMRDANDGVGAHGGGAHLFVKVRSYNFVVAVFMHRGGG